MDYKIVHAIEGRLRLRIPLLSTDAVFAGKLQPLVEAIASVTSVRINALAQSIVITYKSKKISQPVLIAAVEQAIAQVAPPPEEPDEKPDSAATRETADVDLAKPKPPEAAPEALLIPGEHSVTAKDSLINEITFDPSTIDLEEDPWAETPSISLTDAPPSSPPNSSAEPFTDLQESEVVPQTTAESLSEEVIATEACDTVSETAPVPAAASDPASNTIPLASLGIIKAFLEDIPPLSQPLSAKALAARLGVTVQTLKRYCSKPDFSEWSCSKDPDGLVWQLEAASKRFVPVTSEPKDAIPEVSLSSEVDRPEVISATIDSDTIDSEIMDSDTIDSDTAIESPIPLQNVGEAAIPDLTETHEMNLREKSNNQHNGRLSSKSRSKSRKRRSDRPLRSST